MVSARERRRLRLGQAFTIVSIVSYDAALAGTRVVCQGRSKIDPPAPLEN